MTETRKWRRTALSLYGGEPVPNDWSLVDQAGQPLARIYKIIGGPLDGHWFWSVIVDAEGRPWNGGTGYCETGAEAKAAIAERLAAEKR